MLVHAVNLEHAAEFQSSSHADWLDFYNDSLAQTGLRDYLRRTLGGLCPCCWSAPAEVGAPVAFLSWKNRRAYIAPLCTVCASRSDTLALPSYLMCVPIPAAVLKEARLTYPDWAISALLLQNPREALRWDGHPTP